MARASRFAWISCFAFALMSCQAQPQVSPEPSKKPAAKKEGAKTEKKGDSKEQSADREGPQKFVVPFAWEAGKDEPLAQTRAFLRDAFVDNEGYMEHGDKFFASFADKQTPRATIITCADSRVHNQAWDVTPENDDFTVRNIGNQVENSEGSVEYGVENLATPLLLVVGHTGCGAVKAAMGEPLKLGEAVQKEIEHLHIPKPGPGKTPEGAWAEGVIANVNNQVDYSLKRFAKRVQEGSLTVVGAVYDFRNDLQQGAGKLVIVNVNGNTEPERMTAFVEAVKSQTAKDPSKDGKGPKGRRVDEVAVAEDVAAQLAKLHGVTARTFGEPAATKDSHVSRESPPAPAHEH